MNKVQFNQLYEFCQTLQPKVKRNDVINKIREITGAAGIRTVILVLDTAVLRGFFLRADNEEHPLVKKMGHNVIVLAKGMNECWERFVNVKEAMHLLDVGRELTDSKEKFETLLDDWCGPGDVDHIQQMADIMGMWMALACLCPEKNRLEFRSLLDRQQIDHYGIALKLKIPEYYVPFLFRPEYQMFLDAYVNK